MNTQNEEEENEEKLREYEAAVVQERMSSTSLLPWQLGWLW